jgi:hypothetical protein
MASPMKLKAKGGKRKIDNPTFVVHFHLGLRNDFML